MWRKTMAWLVAGSMLGMGLPSGVRAEMVRKGSNSNEVRFFDASGKQLLRRGGTFIGEKFAAKKKAQSHQSSGPRGFRIKSRPKR